MRTQHRFVQIPEGQWKVHDDVHRSMNACESAWRPEKGGKVFRVAMICDASINNAEIPESPKMVYEGFLKSASQKLVNIFRGTSVVLKKEF